MASNPLADLDAQLRRLPADQLARVAEFIAALTRQRDAAAHEPSLRVAETSLRKDWDRPEEDMAWANL
jgi:hypothetical protein